MDKGSLEIIVIPGTRRVFKVRVAPHRNYVDVTFPPSIPGTITLGEVVSQIYQKKDDPSGPQHIFYQANINRVYGSWKVNVSR